MKTGAATGKSIHQLVFLSQGFLRIAVSPIWLIAGKVKATLT
jgi:hypothetical protein